MGNLDELLSALQLGTDVRLMGLSYGGWEAAEYALVHPGRLARVVLIAPAATLFNLPPDFAWRGLLLLLPARGFMESMMRWSLPHLATATDPAGRKRFDSLVEEAYLGMRSFDLRQGAIPRVLSDEQLASIRPATLFMVGEDETLYPAPEAIGRLARVAPRVRDCAHSRGGTRLDMGEARAGAGGGARFPPLRGERCPGCRVVMSDRA